MCRSKIRPKNSGMFIAWCKKSSILRRLTFMILLVSSTTGLISYGIFLYWYMHEQIEEHITVSESVAHVLSQDFARLVLLKDLDTASDMSTKLKTYADLESLALYNNDQHVLYSYTRNPQNLKIKPLDAYHHKEINHPFLDLIVEIKYQNISLGHLVMQFKLKTLQELIYQNIPILSLIAFFLFILSLVLAVIFAKKFTNPILSLVKFLEHVTRYHTYSQKITVNERNEFGTLYQEVNTMLSSIYEANASLKIAAVAFETPSGMIITDSQQNILKVNRAFTEITGYEAADVVGKTPAVLKSGRHSGDFYHQMWLSLNKYNVWNGEIWNRHKNGMVYPEHLTIQAVIDDEQKICYYVASFLDLTTQKQTEAQVEYLKHYDTLTGLANKDYAIVSIQELLHSQKPPFFYALLCISFNNFNMLIDAYNHIIIDKLLQSISQRLVNDFPEYFLCAKIASDEFAVFIHHLPQDKTLAEEYTQRLVLLLISLLSKPFSIHNNTLYMIPSIGIALIEHHFQDVSKIFQHAQSAMHMAKDQKESRFAFYTQEAEAKAKYDLELYHELSIALEQNQFRLYYQPQYNQKHEIIGAEALIRWQHPQKGLLLPSSFIEACENNGLILSIGQWILQEACRLLLSWQQDTQTQDLVLAVNISSQQFEEHSFIDRLKALIDYYTIRPSTLKLELTENVLVKNVNNVQQKMHQIHDLGVLISLDDFGTGYSSLQYLRRLPLDQIKIDQSFVKDVLKNRQDSALIETILSIGKIYRYDVIAEGVETKEQFDFLVTLGCCQFQGYYLSRPIDELQFFSLLTTYKREAKLSQK